MKKISKKDLETAVVAREKKGKQVIRRGIRWYNHRLKKVYSPSVAALTGTVIVLIMAVVILFLPPVTGVADDGSLATVMLQTGLGYRNADLEAPTGAYFIRLYQHSTCQPQGVSVHQAVIRAAMWLDTQFTHDRFFDIRFLALIYLVLYLPAVFLVLRGIASRVKVAAEATFLVIVGALVLGDAAVVAYFNSLYPDALWQVLLTYCFGLCMAMQHEKAPWTQGSLMGLTVVGAALALSESHCAALGFVLTVFCVRQIWIENRTHQTVILAAVAAVVILTASMVSAVKGADRFSPASKMHAMTNGVLMRSLDPEKTLAEFNIDSRFETLADTSAYADYPYALPGNPEIKRDFLDHYSIGTLMLHYLRAPMEYAGLLEMSVSACFSPVRSYVGSFESTAGRPQRAQNGTLTYYSNLKGNSLPQTIGFLIILLIVYWAMFRQRRGLRHHVTNWTFRERQIMLDTFLTMFFCIVVHLSGILLVSGTAELERYKMISSTCVDGMLLLFVSEILHRLNIISSEE